MRPDKGTLAPYGSETKNIVAQWKVLCLSKGTLYRRVGRQSSTVTYYQLVVPLVMRGLILGQLHDLRVVGHMGIARTLSRVQERFYWPNMGLDVARWCAACSDCAGRKGKPPPSRAPSSGVGL